MVSDEFLDSGDGTETGSPLLDVTPRIGEIEPISMKCDYQLPWDRQSNQTACGQTIQYNAGDLNWRIVINGVITISQLRKLDAMRGSENVEIRTAEFGKTTIQFDQLNITRNEDPAAAEIDNKVQPLLEFQLQSKEKDEEPAVEFIN